MKKHQQKGFIPIIVLAIAAFALLLLIYGVSIGFLTLFGRYFTGAATGFFGSGCESVGSVTCPAGDTAKLPSDTGTIARINKNMGFYKQISEESNVPWEVVAGIHYREASNNTTHTKSWANGFGICDNRNGTYNGFENKHGHPCTTYLDDAIGAMDHLQGKVGGKLRKD